MNVSEKNEPVLVTPFAFDQPDNGDRLARLGVGRVLPRSQYSARAAERELSALLTNPRYAQRAEEIGATIAHENGARAAADAILGIS